MKKLLLTSTAIGLFAASAALADGPTITIGGYADFQGGYADQENLYSDQNGTANTAALTKGTAYSRDLHTGTDTEIHIKIDGKTDSGLGYGAYIEMEADVNQDDATGANNNAERSYIYVETGFGRVEAGANGDAGAALRVDAASLARATGGIAGSFYEYVDLGSDSFASTSSYFVLPGLITDVGIPGTDINSATDTHTARATANKVSYYTPRIQGLQAGVSFTPDQSERGTSVGFNSGHNESFKNVWNGGVNYQGNFGDFGLEASATGEIGTTEDNGLVATTRDDLEGYTLGLSGSFAGFSLAGSYGDIGEYGQTAANNSSINYWTLGGAYEFGPFATSVTYMDSTVEHQGGAAVADKEFTNLSIGADYQLAPGLMPYAEVNFFDTDDNVADTATTTDNNGTVVIIGTKISF